MNIPDPEPHECVVVMCYQQNPGPQDDGPWLRWDRKLGTWVTDADGNPIRGELVVWARNEDGTVIWTKGAR